MLSPESRTHLTKFLPPTAFSDYERVLDDPDHPSHAKELNPTMIIDAPQASSSSHPSHAEESDPASMVVDMPQSSQSSRSADNVLLSVFSDPHFLAAAHTFQDHLYSGWLNDSFKTKVKEYEDGILAGTLAAPWKDEEWEREHQLADDETSTSSPKRTRKTGTKAGLVFSAFRLELTNSIFHQVIMQISEYTTLLEIQSFEREIFFIIKETLQCSILQWRRMSWWVYSVFLLRSSVHPIPCIDSGHKYAIAIAHYSPGIWNCAAFTTVSTHS